MAFGEWLIITMGIRRRNKKREAKPERKKTVECTAHHLAFFIFQCYTDSNDM